MSTEGPVATLALPTSSDPRVHLLDDTWILTVFAVLLATALPWLASGFNLDFVAVTIGLLALGALHTAFTVIDRPRPGGTQRTALIVLHSAGVIALAYIWLHAGGLQNPAFLLVFFLPVVGAIFLSRWQPYAIALLAIIAVGGVALAQAPELRWYVPWLDSTGAWLADVLGQAGSASSPPFPGFYAPSSYYVVLLEVFATLLIACAVAAEYLGSVFERLHANVALARTEAERGQELWTSTIEKLPLPALLVEADTLRILCASEAAAGFCSGPDSMGRTLFETVEFSYPDVIQALMTGAGGCVPFSVIRSTARLHVTEIHVQHVARKGRRLVLVVIVDRTDEFELRTALDATEQAVLVIDPAGRVLTCNKPATILFTGVGKGSEAAGLLSLAAMPVWWDAGLRGRRKMHVEIAPRVYQVTSTAVPLPGEDDRMHVVTFQPVARTAVNDTGIYVNTALSPSGVAASTAAHTRVLPP